MRTSEKADKAKFAEAAFSEVRWNLQAMASPPKAKKATGMVLDASARVK